MNSTFHPFNRDSPGAGDPESVMRDGTRWNLNALAAAVAMGSALPGWNYTNSVTRAEASPGTAAQPNRVYMKAGQVWIRAVITWDGNGNPTKLVFSWSEDGEQSYDSLRDLDGNNVLNVTYDGSFNVTAYTWAQT